MAYLSVCRRGIGYQAPRVTDAAVTESRGSGPGHFARWWPPVPIIASGKLPVVSPGPVQLLFLVACGIGGGLTGSIAGLASLVSYPALLAVGLPPVSANVTNTVALLGNTLGAASGSRPELAGQWGRIGRLCVVTAIGGATGGVLLLVTPSEAFSVIVPWLIAGASILLLINPKPKARTESGASHRIGPLTVLAAFAVGVYGGYFGAAAGVLMLALLSAAWPQSLARNNAAKNIATGAANLVAAVVFMLTGPVNWAAAAALCAGLVAGSWAGPAIVRRLPPTPLRFAISVTGLGLAASLAWQSS
jgi:uncharacterized membrane protein YfcA